MKLFNRNPNRRQPLLEALIRFDNFMDPEGDGRYYLIVGIIFLAVMMWLCGPISDGDEPLDRHIRYNEYTRQYYRDVTY